MRSATLDTQIQSAPDSSGFAEVLVVADDLTGACDSGAAFLACGQTVRVVLHPPGAQAESQFDPPGGIHSFNTETRNLTETEASLRVAETTAALANSHPAALLFKKVDSAARGHFGAEILAALEASRAKLVLVAPAFPAAGRAVRSGILTVRDCSGQDSCISLRDQFFSLNPTRIEVLRANSEFNLRIAMGNAIASGVRILLCDADTQQDLNRLAAAAAQLPQSILWAGSSGLARALAATLPAATPKAPPSRAVRHGRTILFSGSPHPVTQLQLSHLEQERPDLKHSVIRLVSDSPTDEEIQRPFTASSVSSLILTGGDTASCVLNALGASSILLAGEIATGIPWGFVENGLADGCIVVTKSGGFGDPNALVNAFEFCRRRSA